MIEPVKELPGWIKIPGYNATDTAGAWQFVDVSRVIGIKVESDNRCYLRIGDEHLMPVNAKLDELITALADARRPWWSEVWHALFS